MEEQGLVQQKKHSLFVTDTKDSKKSDLVLLAIVGFIYLLLGIILLISWSTHNAKPQMMAAGGGLTVLLIVLIAYSWKVKGPRQTIGFFILTPVISFFFEFIGNNYGWWFGTYKYTDSLGPRLGGVPLLIVCVTWPVIIFSSYMLLDWLLDLRGAKRGRSIPGQLIWGAAVAAATATVATAVDMLADPVAVSGLWPGVAGTKPWWWWSGGPYLKELKVWKGTGGIPVGNFFGWWVAIFVIIMVFYLIFQKPNLVNDKLVNLVPVLIYIFLFFTLGLAALEMNWHENGFDQVFLIGFFTMGPVSIACLVKFLKRYMPEKKLEAVS